MQCVKILTLGNEAMVPLVNSSKIINPDDESVRTLDDKDSEAPLSVAPIYANHDFRTYAAYIFIRKMR